LSAIASCIARNATASHIVVDRFRFPVQEQLDASCQWQLPPHFEVIVVSVCCFAGTRCCERREHVSACDSSTIVTFIKVQCCQIVVRLCHYSARGLCQNEIAMRISTVTTFVPAAEIVRNNTKYRHAPLTVEKARPAGSTRRLMGAENGAKACEAAASAHTRTCPVKRC
jgi:hypothetical protein